MEIHQLLGREALFTKPEREKITREQYSTKENVTIEVWMKTFKDPVIFAVNDFERESKKHYKNRTGTFFSLC